MTDKVDKALQELAEFAADSWSNSAIVDRVHAVRALRASEIDEAIAQAAHAKAMREEVCFVLGITPGALMAIPSQTVTPA